MAIKLRNFPLNPEGIMSYSLPVNLLTQFHFCPRIPYFQELLKMKPFYPQWVKQGRSFHEAQEKVFQHRTLKRFGLQKAEQKFNIEVQSQKLHLHGILDSLLVTKKAIFPVEFKLSERKPSKGQIIQLTAYAMLIEESMQLPCQKGFLLIGKKGKCYPIEFTDFYKNKVLETKNKILDSFEKSYLPDSSASLSQCYQCEYLNYCNDRE